MCMKSGVRRLGLVVTLALALVVTGLLAARWVLSWQPVDGQERSAKQRGTVREQL